METKYKRGDVLYLARGTIMSKCVVDEMMIHYVHDGSVVVKYIIRPFGFGVEKSSAVEESELVKTHQEAYEKVVGLLKENYEKSLENIEAWTDAFYDDLEDKLQKPISEQTEK